MSGGNAKLTEAMEAAIRSVAPADLLELIKQANSSRESKYIEHTEAVVVYEVNPAELALIDSIPGHFMEDVKPGDLDGDGKVMEKHQTVDGQIKVHVYKVELSLNPGAPKGGEYTIVKNEDWEKSQAAQATGMTSGMQQAASLIARSGDVGDEV